LNNTNNAHLSSTFHMFEVCQRSISIGDLEMGVIVIHGNWKSFRKGWIAQVSLLAVF
jgi:hypothetical protein